MTFFGRFRRRRATPQANRTRQEVEVEARRQYAEQRRREAFKQQATDEDWRAWERGREQGQESGLF